jgi:hypothetical protein
MFLFLMALRLCDSYSFFHHGNGNNPTMIHVKIDPV